MLVSAMLIATAIIMLLLLGCVVVAFVELIRTIAKIMDQLP